MARIYLVDKDYKADVKVFEVNHKDEADLLYCLVDKDTKAQGDALWYYVDKDYDATCKVFCVDHDYNADLKIFRVNNYNEAKWQNNHKLKNKISK
jgi:hypothetical protein